MATYLELHDLAGNENFRLKVKVASVIAAEEVRGEAPATSNHANRLLWAREVFKGPHNVIDPMIWAVLAQNKNATTAQILSATDASIQTAVNNAIDVLAGV